jgi:hypothetical protein
MTDLKYPVIAADLLARTVWARVWVSPAVIKSYKSYVIVSVWAFARLIDLT